MSLSQSLKLREMEIKRNLSKQADNIKDDVEKLRTEVLNMRTQITQLQLQHNDIASKLDELRDEIRLEIRMFGGRNETDTT